MTNEHRIGYISLFLSLLINFSSGQNIVKDSGISAEIIGGKLDVLNVYGPQLGLRVGVWPTSFLQIGGEGTVAASMQSDWHKHNPDDKFFKLHFYTGLYLRIFKNFYPYVIGSLGPQFEYTVDNFDDNKKLTIKNGATLKVGLSLELDKYRISVETGGGTLGTGHVVTNLCLGYTFTQLPKYKPIKNFNLKAGYHTFYSFKGPYEGADGPSFDIILETKKGNITREFNAGIFFTDYIYNTGVFNLGTGWRLDGNHKIFDYVDITPGFQILIWVEGDPDFILPTASLGLGIHTELGKFIPFINTRTLLTYSRADDIFFGSTITVGIGISL